LHRHAGFGGGRRGRCGVGGCNDRGLGRGRPDRRGRGRIDCRYIGGGSGRGGSGHNSGIGVSGQYFRGRGHLHDDSGGGHRGADVHARCKSLFRFRRIAATGHLRGVRGGRIVIVVQVITGGRGRRIPRGHLFDHVHRVVGWLCGRLATLEGGGARHRCDDDNDKGGGRRLHTAVITSATSAPYVGRHDRSDGMSGDRMR